jgi:HPt (histidine-containing phosphotransfer) domain-containing protein
MPTEPTPAYARELDAEALERLRALDPTGANALLERVLGTFRGSLERLLPQMRDGRHKADPQVVRHVAHTLKSSSASVGALRLSQLCAEVEQALRRNAGLGSIDTQLDELLDEARRLLAVLPPAVERPR